MTPTDVVLLIKALIYCKYLNVDDFLRMLYTKGKFIAYLQEMSTLFRKMSVNQVRAVHGFSHVRIEEAVC